MIKLISVLTTISLLTMVLTIYLQLPLIFLAASIMTNLAYAVIQCYQKTEQQKLFSMIFHGQVIINALYTVWVFFLQSHEYIFYVPLSLSMSAKVYEILTAKEYRNETLSENYILLQGKLQFLMLIYLVLLMLVNIVTINFNIKSIVMFLLALLLFRIKYQTNYAFQRSINEIHLFFDRISKKSGFRNCYHKFYKFFVKLFCVGDYNSGKRVVRY